MNQLQFAVEYVMRGDSALVYSLSVCLEAIYFCVSGSDVVLAGRCFFFFILLVR